MLIYTVKPGDTLYEIARTYGTDYQQLAYENMIDPEKTLVVGQTVVIPNAGDMRKLGNLEVNGYANEYINLDVLNMTLPYLTYVSIFSYEIRADGSLEGINDEPIINACHEQGVAPVMVVTNLGESGGFDSELAHTILGSNILQQTLRDNILSIMEEKGYRGLDLDLEYIFPYDRVAYNNFLEFMRQAMHDNGYFITTAVAPKIETNQPGLLYEGHDYAFHGKTADHVIIMTYEWGYTYSPPMAVAPLNQVKKVLDYAVTQIPPGKIFMGIPNYGYVWNIPFISGTAATAIGNVEAVDIARDNNAAIEYDLRAQSPNFNYYLQEQAHEVWFEDANSIYAKLVTAYDYNLGGVSYWTINRYFPQNWMVLSSLFNIVKI